MVEALKLSLKVVGVCLLPVLGEPWLSVEATLTFGAHPSEAHDIVSVIRPTVVPLMLFETGFCGVELPTAALKTGVHNGGG